MKSIVLYSSLTGNTKQVAEAITSVLPAGTPCVDMKQLPADLADYDLVVAGFWVDRGTANAEARKVLETLNNKHVAIFATCGVPTQMPHARESLENAAKLLLADPKNLTEQIVVIPHKIIERESTPDLG